MEKNRQIIISGLIANHNQKPFQGSIYINTKTGLIERVSKTNPNRKVDYSFPKSCLIFPGMGDVHIHAREDQTGRQKYKEEYKTTGDAALNGGCVHISAMPNTPKPLTTKSDLAWHRKRVEKIAHPVSILNYIGIDSKTKPLGKPGEHFYKLYFGKSVGDLSVIYAGELDKILERYKGHNISFHVEYEPIVQASSGGDTHSDRRPRECVNEGLRLLLPLICKYKIKAKLCHWSLGGDSFNLIAQARKEGAHIELEVSPLHLLFDRSMTDKNPELWTKIQMNPAVQTPRDRKDLIEGLRNGFIQYLATDHASHTEEEKFSAFAQFKDEFPGKSNVEIAEIIKSQNKKLYLQTCKQNGMSGAPWLDTYALVAVHLMKKHKFTPQDIARVTAYNPGRFVNPYLKRQFPKQNFGKGFGLIEKGYIGSLTVLNTREKTLVKREDLKTKAGWSPLEDWVMPGKVAAVFISGVRIK